MNRVFLCLGFVALLSGAARAEFVVKYFIDGHIYAPSACGTPTGNSRTCWVAEMDGDTSSPEMLVFGTVGNGPQRQTIGITHLATGETQWFEQQQVGSFPSQTRSGIWDNVIFEVPALLYDVDGDNLLDALVPVWGGPYQQRSSTVVIGWAASPSATGPGPSGPPLTRPSAVFPNPAPGSCRVSFSVPATGPVSVQLFDASGRLIRDLLDGSLPAGEYAPAWDGKDAAGNDAVAGVYFFKVTMPSGESKGQVALIR